MNARILSTRAPEIMPSSRSPHELAGLPSTLAQLIELIPTAALAYDFPTGFHWNRHAEELLGISSGAPGHGPVYRRISRTGDGEQVLAHELVLEAFTRHGTPPRREIYLVVQGAENTRLRVTATTGHMTLEGGVGLGAIAIFQAIPEYPGCWSDCPVASGLQAQVRERENVLSAVLHDLRGPLQSLMFYAWNIEDAARGTGGNGDIAEIAATMRHVCRMTADLLDDLLAESVPGGLSPAKLSLSRLAPGEFIRFACQQAAPMIENRRVQLHVEVQPDLPPVLIDVPRLLRAFGNLLENASKFTEPGGFVKLGAEAAGPCVRFWVCNSGPAVPQSVIDRMFSPFWQAAVSSAGTGLGLAICRSIVEAHGGSVWAEPEPGMRVCMNVLLRTA